MKEQLELKGEQDRIKRQIANLVQQVRSLERQIQELHEQYVNNTQVTDLLQYYIQILSGFKSAVGGSKESEVIGVTFRCIVTLFTPYVQFLPNFQCF